MVKMEDIKISTYWGTFFGALTCQPNHVGAPSEITPKPRKTRNLKLTSRLSPFSATAAENFQRRSDAQNDEECNRRVENKIYYNSTNITLQITNLPIYYETSN